MNVTILYANGAPSERDVQYLARQLTDRRITATLVDADTREGTALTELYEAMERPAVLVTGGDGRLVQKWQGQLPRAEDIAALTGFSA